ncbi:MAG: hypothetical protein UZ20_WS6002000317 [candidate division WS6 bacterium OLB21]|uniref:Uncharacterized protein n=1 Tax=candidate division WS6 bacterium OLB21 TaxID=1617427 RepID=A0A136KK08_9BACT|nr:MAG: hypothetical protein UZ20_WS6002000317 [candidate division WS6 bacterium OLB21]
MHNIDKNPNPSNIIKASASSKLLTFAEYKDNTTIEKATVDFVYSVKSMLDTKFILIISPEIERYLEWVSDNRRMHKAQVVRRAVEDTMEKDKEYKDYLKKEYGI